MRSAIVILSCALLLSAVSCTPREARHGGPEPVRVEIRLVSAESRPGFHAMDLGGDKLYVADGAALSSENVLRTQVVKGPLGDPAVEVGFDSDGRKALADLTTEHVGDKLGILLDGRLTSAMTIRDPITGGTALITGDFTRAQARDLAKRIMAGK